MRLSLVALPLFLVSLVGVCSADAVLLRATSVSAIDNFQSFGSDPETPFAARDKHLVNTPVVPSLRRATSFDDEDSHARSARSGRTARRLGPLRRKFSTDSDGDSDDPVTNDPLTNSSAAVVPEPGTLALFGTGLTLLAGALRRRARHA